MGRCLVGCKLNVTCFFVVIVIVLTVIVTSSLTAFMLKAELILSTNQQDWKKCRTEAWEGCGLGDNYDKVIQPMNARYSRSDKEVLEYIEPLISYCWDNVAEYKCDQIRKVQSSTLWE